MTKDQLVEVAVASPHAAIHTVERADRLYEYLELEARLMPECARLTIVDFAAEIGRADPARSALACDVAAYTMFVRMNAPQYPI
jgi:hypothetical protein